MGHVLRPAGREGLAVAREAAQDGRVPAPLFQHLRRRLDEVPLRPHSGDPCPADATAEEMVQEVTELVEEGHHLAVLEELARPGEVADERRLGQRAVRPA